MRRVCVFCGSSPGRNPRFVTAATAFGRLLAERGLELVYGGSRVGLMGVVADAALAGGGTVTGVIPGALVSKEVAHDGLTSLRVVASMHERKALMEDLADGFVALPGGLGTLDEFFEICTWAQLGIHHKPCAVLNVDGFFDRLFAFLDHAAAEGLLTDAHRRMIIDESDGAVLLDRMGQHVPPAGTKWMDDTGR